MGEDKELIDRLLDIRGVSLVNLQCGEAARGFGLPDLTPWLTDYGETAAMIATLDLVVTVDKSIAHLAGALGKPVWILLPHAPDWRWLLSRTDSPWYRSARLYRQPTAGDWTSVLARVVDEIKRHHWGSSVRSFTGAVRAQERRSPIVVANLGALFFGPH